MGLTPIVDKYHLWVKGAFAHHQQSWTACKIQNDKKSCQNPLTQFFSNFTILINLQWLDVPGISQTYFKCGWGISHAYLKHILGISQVILSSSAKAQVHAGLSWLYSQLIQPPIHPPGRVFSQLKLTKYV